MIKPHLFNKETRSYKKIADLPSSLNTSLSPIASAVKTSLAGLVGLSLAHGAAQAATIQVTSNSDDRANGADCTLREAITAINNAPRIALNNGCVLTGTFGNNDTVTFSSNMPGNTIVLNQGDIGIFGDITISINAASVTGGITIDANESSRVLTISRNGAVSLNNLTIMNGSSSDTGGGIRANPGSSVELIDSKLLDNYASFGGGIYAREASITVIDSTISGNSAGDGGGISAYESSTVELNNTTVSNNTAARGGGIEVVSGTTLELRNSTVTNNSAIINGGGIHAGLPYRDGGTVVNVVNSTLSSNKTTGESRTNPDSNGGAIFAINSSTITVSNSTLNGNSAFDDGGAIHAVDSTVEISNSTLSSNSAFGNGPSGEEIDGDGGANYARGQAMNLTLSNSTLSGNDADDDGGAVFVRQSGTVTIENSTLSNNKALDDGGGLAIFSYAKAFINNSIFANSDSTVDCYFPSAFATVTIDTSTIIQSGGCKSSRPIDPGLEPLADNGGPRQTHALQRDSPARDSGILATCTATDQLGQLRNDGDGLCDVGAVEYLPVSDDFHVIPLRNDKSVIVPL